MPIDRDNLRDLLTALGIIGAAMLAYWLLLATPAHAQIAVTDPPVETATAQTASELNATNKTLAKDLQKNTKTAQPVTTGGGAGAWQSNEGYSPSLGRN